MDTVSASRPAILVLEDGSVFKGLSIGVDGDTVGEVVFKNAPCCGCRQETCLRPDANCMELIGVEEVWDKVKGLLVTP